MIFSSKLAVRYWKLALAPAQISNFILPMLPGLLLLNLTSICASF